MMKFHKATFVGFFVTFGFTFLSSAQIEAADLGKIMPLGDSITLGVGSPATGGYREPLYDLLTEAGHDFEFVGSLSDYQGGLPNAQKYHEGHSGYVISAGTSGRGGIADNIATWLGPSGVTPDIILLMIGSNDVSLDYKRYEAPDRLSSLISVISNKETGLAPNAKLIVAQIVPRADAATNTKVITFNASVATMVAFHQDLGENVSLVDMYTALNGSADLSDLIHPNKGGYEKMAKVWVDGIQAATAVPEPSSIVVFITGLLALSLCTWRRKVGVSKIA